VADFGLSKVSVTGNTLNSKVGSLNWCAPEILLQSMPYTDKADVYSFGMVLWELLTHEAPFAGMHPLQIVRAIDQVRLAPLHL
jgi:serine/threonine protein kinase